MVSLPSNILVTKGASMLAEVLFLLPLSVSFSFSSLTLIDFSCSFFQGFKFAQVVGQHVTNLKENNLALRGELEQAREDLVWAE